jgi:hypothetical protein
LGGGEEFEVLEAIEGGAEGLGVDVDGVFLEGGADVFFGVGAGGKGAEVGDDEEVEEVAGAGFPEGEDGFGGDHGGA